MGLLLSAPQGAALANELTVAEQAGQQAIQQAISADCLQGLPMSQQYALLDLIAAKTGAEAKGRRGW